MPEKQFHIFPWTRPFLENLKSFVHARTGGRPELGLIIFPHKRPLRYMASLYAKEKKAAILPKMIGLSEAAQIWNASLEKGKPMLANSLDQVALLKDCIDRLALEDQKLAAKFASMDMAAFLPWGLRLAALLEEMAREGSKPQDLEHLEDEVAKPAAALLGALGRVNRIWRENLDERGWTTKGMGYARIMDNAAAIPGLLAPREDRHVFIAGFSRLSGMEEAMFRSLWQNGACVCLHADPALAENKQGHWACQHIREWLKKWRATPVPAFPQAKEAAPETKYSFFAGYDGHSQLEEMARIISAREDCGNTAIVLCDENMLMPALHHLPDRDINISMGYPLRRSPLSDMLDAVFNLQANQREEGLYHWRDLIQLFHLPFMNDLRQNPEEGDNSAWLSLLRTINKQIRAGERHVRARDLLAGLGMATDEGAYSLFAQCLEIFLENPSGMASMRQMADVFQQICDFIPQHTSNFWTRYPLDAEALARLSRNALPLLRENLLADLQFSLTALRQIMDMTTREERVPFEADPIVGLQVLGMLETRLLQFDRVIILDATDDLLPGNAPQDPLLPDSLRGVLGLPDAHSREIQAAYNLHRLCAGAKEAHFLWQEGISRSGLFDGKKMRSRFVEELIWNVEKKKGALLERGEEPLTRARTSISIKNREALEIALEGAIRGKMEQFLAGAVSATALDLYLGCPLKFAYSYLFNLAPQAEANEGDDPLGVGQLIHDVLKNFYEPFLKVREIPEISESGLLDVFQKKLEASGLRDRLPPDSCIALELAAQKQLSKFVNKQNGQKDKKSLKFLEQKFYCDISVSGHAWRLTGKVDRVDERKGLLHVLDYKTGKFRMPRPDLWGNEDFFAKLGEYCKNPGGLADAADIYLEELKELLPSVQLPLYMLLLRKNGMANAANAAFVDLRDSCEEKEIFNFGSDAEALDLALKHCETAIAFILHHMENAKIFHVANGVDCEKYCDYSSLCKC